MKKFIGHKEITLVIGIIVAVVIALTLWIAGPHYGLTGSTSRPTIELPRHKKAVHFPPVELIDFLRRHTVTR